MTKFKKGDWILDKFSHTAFGAFFKVTQARGSSYGWISYAEGSYVEKNAGGRELFEAAEARLMTRLEVSLYIKAEWEYETI